MGGGGGGVRLGGYQVKPDALIITTKLFFRNCPVQSADMRNGVMIRSMIKVQIRLGQNA